MPIDSEAAAFFVLASRPDAGFDFWRAAALTPTPAHLPAIASFVSFRAEEIDILRLLSGYPYPASLPAVYFPFFRILLSAWARAGDTLSLRPMIHIDSCAFHGLSRTSLLPRWLPLLRRFASRPNDHLFALGYLSNWRPAAGSIFDSQDLASWADSWVRLLASLRVDQSRHVAILTAVIARALLHLPAGTHPLPLALISEPLGGGFKAALNATFSVRITKHRRPYNFFLLVAPEPPLPMPPPVAELMGGIIAGWLDWLPRLEGKGYVSRYVARQLARWGYFGHLAACNLIPRLTALVHSHLDDGETLGALASIPVSGATSEQLQELAAVWRSLRGSSSWLARAAAWTAEAQLRRAGFAPQDWDDYLRSLCRERHSSVLTAMAGIVPSEPNPEWLAAWERKPQSRHVVDAAVCAYAVRHGAFNGLRRRELQEWSRNRPVFAWRTRYAHVLASLRAGVPSAWDVPRNFRPRGLPPLRLEPTGWELLQQ